MLFFFFFFFFGEGENKEPFWSLEERRRQKSTQDPIRSIHTPSRSAVCPCPEHRKKALCHDLRPWHRTATTTFLDTAASCRAKLQKPCLTFLVCTTRQKKAACWSGCVECVGRTWGHLHEVQLAAGAPPSRVVCGLRGAVAGHRVLCAWASHWRGAVTFFGFTRFWTVRRPRPSRSQLLPK